MKHENDAKSGGLRSTQPMPPATNMQAPPIRSACCGTPLFLMVALFVAVAPPEALAQSGYPNRPIRIVVPGAAGAGFDTVARLMAPGLTERLGRQVVVENRAGAGTMIGNEFVARAPADGYTLLMCANALAIHPAIYAKVPYEALRDFAPITQTTSVPNVMVVHPSVPARSVKEIVALAKARPDEIRFASAGHGTSGHLTLELFANMAQIRMIHVPYKSTTPGLIDVMAGNVAITATSTMEALPHVRAGRVRALGVTSAHRIAVAPDLPAVAEVLPGYESVNWFGLLAPAGTPSDIIARLHKESVAVLRAAGIKERIVADGIEVVGNTPEEFAAFIKTETAKWAAVVKAAGITPE